MAGGLPPAPWDRPGQSGLAHLTSAGKGTAQLRPVRLKFKSVAHLGRLKAANQLNSEPARVLRISLESMCRTVSMRPFARTLEAVGQIQEPGRARPYGASGRKSGEPARGGRLRKTGLKRA